MSISRPFFIATLCFIAVSQCLSASVLLELQTWTGTLPDQNDEFFVIKSVERHYWAPLSASEKKDIRFIVTTLADKTIAKILKNKRSIEEAGDRLHHLHPFNFLYAIFGDEELKVGMRNIRKRDWVWSDFLSGLKNSLKDEALKNNLQEEFIQDFANKLEIDHQHIVPFIQNRQWVELVDKLIELVPRKEGYDRYNM